MATSKSDREELLSNLSTYRLQLQQVEAALTTDPENDDLLKLRNDLEEVINLTEDLVTTQVGPGPSVAAGADGLVIAPKYPGRGLAAGGTREGDDEDDDDYGVADDDDNDDEEMESARAWLTSDFKSGDKCRAPWTDSSGDTQYYPATIDEILEDGTCSVVFERYGSTEVTKVSLLRPPGSDSAEETNNKKKLSSSKKDRIQAQREYKRKKAQKKAQRLKQYEDEREQDKNKWQSFNTKIFSKTSKGRVKKSIFASLDEETIVAKVGQAAAGTAAASAGGGGRPVHMKYNHIKK